jgi:predicted aspartyl protease
LGDYTAFTYRVLDNHRHAIVIDIQLGVPVPIHGYPKDKRILLTAKALVDTGATNSCISQDFVRASGLLSFRKTTVHSAQGEFISSVYQVDIIFPNRLMIQKADVIEFNKNQDFDFIIGMDILRIGDCAITNANGITVFSFRVPSDNRHIDFTKSD